MPEKKQSVSTRLLESEVLRIDALAKRLGVSRFVLMRRLLLESLERLEGQSQADVKADASPDILSRLDAIERRLDRLENKEQPETRMLLPAMDAIANIETEIKPDAMLSPAKESPEVERRARECGLSVEEVRSMFPWLG